MMQAQADYLDRLKPRKCSPPRVDKLLMAVKQLEKIVEKQSEQIASLLQLEHKPVVEQEEPEPLTAIDTTLSVGKTAKRGTAKSDYLYGMTFATKK